MMDATPIGWLPLVFVAVLPVWAAPRWTELLEFAGPRDVDATPAGRLLVAALVAVPAVLVTPGHWDNVEHRVCVTEGHWTTVERRECVSEGRWQTVAERDHRPGWNLGVSLKF